MSAARNRFDAAGFCALPLVRRAYMGLAVGLAMFIALLAVLREPFRGYLAEVRVSGPAASGLDLDDASRWLKQAEPRAVIVAATAMGRPPRGQLRMTYLAPRPTPAAARLDELAARWLYQYLPDRLQVHRREVLSENRAAASTARDSEDAARAHVEVLRQQQIARLFQQTGAAGQSLDLHPRGAYAPRSPVDAPRSPVDVPRPADQGPLQARLESLRAELSRLVATFTDEHPQVIAVRWQIAVLEQDLGLAPPSELTVPIGPELVPEPHPSDRHAAGAPGVRSAAAQRFVTTPAGPGLTPLAESPALTAADLETALKELARTSRERQAAEQRLSERMQELSSQPTAADWSAAPAAIVTRLGGTPRCATLAAAGLAAAICAGIMFWASASAVLAPKLATTGELAAALEIPVVADASRLRGNASRASSLTPLLSRLIVHLAEVIVLVAVAACLGSIAVEPSLAAQVAADPFGTLSEVIGRTLAR